GGSIQLYLVKADAGGNISWSKTYGTTADDFGYDVKQTNDGGYIFVGTLLQDIYLVKTNASGDTLWTRTFLGSGNDYAHYVSQTNDHGYIITGACVSYGA